MPKSIDGLFVDEVEQFFTTNPYMKDYIGDGGSCKLAKFQQERGYQLQPGESPDDDCLSFHLQKIPSKDVNLPTETQGGFRIFYLGFENGKRIELP